MSAIRLHASGLAGFVGKHPYVKQHEAFEEVWKRVSPSSYATAMQRHSKESDGQRLVRLKSEYGSIIDVALEHAFSTGKTVAARDVSNIIREAESLVDQTVREKLTDADDLKCIKDNVRKNAFTTYGSARERAVLDILQEEMHFNLSFPNTALSMDFCSRNGTHWKLVGKVDAVTDDGKIVIEVKNRVHRLFFKLSPYERIQIECYLRLLPNVEKGLLVESMKCQVEGKTTLNIIPVERDDPIWEECIAKAGTLIEFLEALVHNEGAQDAYLRSKRQSAYLRTIIENTGK